MLWLLPLPLRRLLLLLRRLHLRPLQRYPDHQPCADGRYFLRGLRERQD
jgi:hypothetical protein